MKRNLCIYGLTALLIISYDHISGKKVPPPPPPCNNIGTLEIADGETFKTDFRGYMGGLGETSVTEYSEYNIDSLYSYICYMKSKSATKVRIYLGYDNNVRKLTPFVDCNEGGVWNKPGRTTKYFDMGSLNPIPLSATIK